MQRRFIERLGQSAQLDARADSAIRIVLLKLIAPTPDAQRWPEKTPRTLEVAGGEVEVMLEREAERLDLNTADDEQLFEVLVTGGWRNDTARAMVARIADWKDADDSTRPEGAERLEYRRWGRRYEPRNGPFESVQELRQLIGGEAFDERQLDAFTVYTHTREPVTTTLVSTSGEEPSLLGDVVRVRACARQQSFERCRVAIVRLTGSVKRPLQVFAWEGYSDVFEG
jgi:hypothetical protein